MIYCKKSIDLVDDHSSHWHSRSKTADFCQWYNTTDESVNRPLKNNILKPTTELITSNYCTWTPPQKKIAVS